MKVSILIATYNRPKELERALKSIKNQTYRDFEVIVINDAGVDVEDVTHSVDIKQRRMYATNFKNEGPTATFQKALDLSTGDYILQLDDDDRLLLSALESFAEEIKKHDNPDAVFSVCLRGISENKCIGTYPPPKYNFTIENMKQRNWCVSCSRIIKADVLKNIGFDKTLEVLVDFDLNLKLFLYYRTIFSKSITSCVYLSTDSWHQTHKKKAQEELEIIKERYADVQNSYNIIGV